MYQFSCKYFLYFIFFFVLNWFIKISLDIIAHHKKTQFSWAIKISHSWIPVLSETGNNRFAKGHKRIGTDNSEWNADFTFFKMPVFVLQPYTEKHKDCLLGFKWILPMAEETGKTEIPLAFNYGGCTGNFIWAIENASIRNRLLQSP